MIADRQRSSDRNVASTYTALGRGQGRGGRYGGQGRGRSRGGGDGGRGEDNSSHFDSNTGRDPGVDEWDKRGIGNDSISLRSTN